MRSEAWRPAAAACNRWPREAREVVRQALRPGCEELAARVRRQLPAVVGRRAPEETQARPRGPKPPRWSAERRASRVISAFTRVLTRYGTQGASQAPGLPRHVQAPRVPLHPNVSRRSAHPSFGVSEAKLQNPGRKNAPRERDGLFEK